jgi:hypothetical protein
MLNVNRILMLSLAALMFACNVKDEKKDESKLLSYQFKVGDCDTGKKTFTSLEGYCQALANDEANHFCAQELRQQQFQKSCSQVAKPTSAPKPSQPEKNPQSKSDPSAGASENPQTSNSNPAPAPVPETGKAGSSQVAALTEVTLSGHFEKVVKVSPENSGDEMISTLDGKIVIDDIAPKVDRPIQLGRFKAATFTSLDMSKCDLQINQYDSSADNKTIGFTILGLDQKAAIGATGCLPSLSTMAMVGFTVEFQDVPVGGNLSQDVIQKVILKVKPKSE